MNHEEEFNVEGYDHAFANEPLFQDLPYGSEAHGHDQAGYEEEPYGETGEDAENFPEPNPKQKGDGDKKKMGPAQMAIAAVVLVVVAGGAAFATAPDMVKGMLPTQITSLFGGDAPDTSPEPPVAKPHRGHHAVAHKAPDGDAAPAPAPGNDQMAAKPADGEGAPKPHARHHAHAAAKPAGDDTAAKPAGDDAQPMTANDPEFKAPPKHAAAHKKPNVPKVAAVPPTPKKPAPKHAAPKLAAAAAGNGPSTSVGFASGSYWVAASEVEKLWAYTSHLKANSGEFTVESWTGSEHDGATLSRKRAARVAELLGKNTSPHAFKVNVKVHPAGSKAAHSVNISFSSKL